jgi:hypothetical protein
MSGIVAVTNNGPSVVFVIRPISPTDVATRLNPHFPDELTVLRAFGAIPV